MFDFPTILGVPVVKILKAQVLVFAIFMLLSPAKAEGPSSQAADTPWPMYQHDPQHTGRSPLLGPTHPPVLLWTAQLPGCFGESGGMTITPDGNLLISVGECLHNFDPVARELRWIYGHGGHSRCVPLVAEDGNIYWGYGEFPGSEINQISPQGETNLRALLDPNLIFGSSPTFGVDGNLYFIHDGLWSFTPSLEYRWYAPYGYLATHANPAIGPDGTIYAGGAQDLCAYRPDPSVEWCLDTPGNAFDKTPAIGSDGTIYMPSEGRLGLDPPFPYAGALVAVSTTGEVNWTYVPDMMNDFGISDGMAITADGTIYFGLNTGVSDTQNYLYAVHADGQFQWKTAFPVQPITEKRSFIRYPLTTDRAGNAYLCTENSRCYGIGPDGSLLWEFEFPLADSLIVFAATQPIIARDGLIYVVDSESRLYALADPDQVPALYSSIDHLYDELEPGTASYTTTIPIDSTLSPITFTASISPSVGWISITAPVSVTPSELLVQYKPELLPAGSYHALIQVKSSRQAGAWLDIPVTMNIGLDQVYLPVTQSDYLRNRILFFSNWFQDPQIASIDPTGQDRRVIAHNVLAFITYSPDGKRAALEVDINGIYQINLVDIQTWETLYEIVDPVGSQSPSWSPDGDRLVFISQRDHAKGELYVTHADGSDLIRLTDDNQEYKTNPLWSPAGDRIAFQALNNVFLINPDGSDIQQVNTGNLADNLVGWSPDGQSLLLHSIHSSDNPMELGVFELQTGVYRFLTYHYHDDGVWSPDGTRIAFTGYEQASSQYDVFVIHADGSGEINLTGGPLQDEFQPAWSPDSRWLVFTIAKEYPLSGKNNDLYVIRPDGSGLRQITSNLQNDSFPFWQP